MNDTRRPADFSERALAFALDYALCALGWAATLKAFNPSEPLGTNPLGPVATLMWTGLFVVYQAYFSSEGRVSLGKRLLGLRVAGPDGQDLDLSQAIVRSLGYLASQVLTAGFLWALLDPNGRAWHDLPVGSQVLSVRPATSRRLAFSRLAAGSLMIVFAASWSWKGIWAPRYEKIMTVANAQSGLQEFAQLQKIYKLRHGRYAQNMFALAEVSVDPGGFLRGAAALYEKGAVAFRIEPSGFTMVARAHDMDKTLIAVSGS